MAFKIQRIKMDSNSFLQGSPNRLGPSALIKPFAIILKWHNIIDNSSCNIYSLGVRKVSITA